MATLAADTEDPELRLLARETTTLVHVALDRLPAHYARALEWKYLEAVPVIEIGRRLELSPKAAESLLTRAREAFRQVNEGLQTDRTARSAGAPAGAEGVDTARQPFFGVSS